MSILADIQTLGSGRLESDEAFFDPAKIPVVTERVKSLGTQIETALGQLGLCACVLTPSFSVKNQNAPSPYFDDIKLMARVWENVPINEQVNPDGPTALDVCERIVFLWHNFRAHGICESFVAEQPTIVLSPVKAENLVAYDVLFSTKAPGTKLLTVVAPTLSINAGLLNAACMTASAAIFYTRDGSYPRPANPSALLYAGPVAVDSGDLITAGAYKAGAFPSSLNIQTAP